MNRTAQILLYIVSGLVSFIVFMVLLFPLDAMISHFLAELESQTKGNQNLKISVASIDASLIFDTEFTEFRLYKDDQEVFYAPKVSAGLSLLPLISGSINARFLAEYNRGQISGKIKLSGDSVLDLDIANVSLKELTYLTRYLKEMDYPIYLSGIVNGSIYFAWSKDLRNKEAEISLKIARAKTKPVFIKDIGMEIPALVLSKRKTSIEIEGGLERGQITISKFNIPGPDIVFDLSGNSRMNNKNRIVRTNIGGKLSFSDKLAKSLPFLMMLDAQKAPDGSFPFSVKGSLKKPIIKIGDMDLSKLLKF